MNLTANRSLVEMLAYCARGGKLRERADRSTAVQLFSDLLAFSRHPLISIPTQSIKSSDCKASLSAGLRLHAQEYEDASASC